MIATLEPARQCTTEAGVTLCRARVCMGVLVSIEGRAVSGKVAEMAVQRAFDAVSAISQRLHPRGPHSDLQRIASSPLGVAVSIHPETERLLRFALRLNISTAGIFDPCLPHLPGRLHDIELQSGPPGRAAAPARVVCRRSVALDFGGFAKGFAVDCAIESLMEHGCCSGLVNAGGDLRVFGARTERLLLAQPGGRWRSVRLSDAALAVSDLDAPDRPAEHQGYYRGAHRIDMPRATRRYAAVTAARAVVADALTKCVLLCAAPMARRVLCEFEAGSLCGPRALNATVGSRSGERLRPPSDWR